MNCLLKLQNIKNEQIYVKTQPATNNFHFSISQRSLTQNIMGIPVALRVT